jgi:hypothetical protein
MARYLEMPRESERDLKQRLTQKVPAGQYGEKWEQIAGIYRKFVADVPDIGGEKNPMCKNLYGALACFAWYEAFDPKPSDDEMRDVLRGNTIRGDGKGGLSKINLNNFLVQKIFYFLLNIMANKFNRRKADGSWGNSWGISVNPLHRKEGISIHLVGCPIADFAKSHGYQQIMPLFCESDYESARLNMGKSLYREHTVADGFEDCDYWIRNI